MVYLTPTQRQNPIRRFLSSRALKVPSLGVGAVVGCFLFGKAYALIINALAASGPSAQVHVAKFSLPLLDEAYAAFLRWCAETSKEPASSVESQGRWIYTALAVTSLAGVVMSKWRQHATPRPLNPESLEVQTFFYEEPNIVTPSVHRCVPESERGRGSIHSQPDPARVDEPQGGWKPWPEITVQNVLERGFNTVGQTAWKFFWTDLAIGTEYPLTSSCRVVGNAALGFIGSILGFIGFKSLSDRILKAPNRYATRENLYMGFINTAYACFLDMNPQSPYYGDIVMPKVTLPKNDQTYYNYTHVIFHLDHATQTFVKVTMIHRREQEPDKEVVEVWGSTDLAENTFHELYDKIMTPERQRQEQLHQAALIAETVVAFYSHSAVHWWANGAALISSKVWPAVEQSTNITQWMNTQAVFGSWFFFGNEQAVTASFLAYNACNGLPVHHPPMGDKASAAPATRVIDWERVLASSKMHQMNYKCRKNVNEVLNEMDTAADALIAAAAAESPEAAAAAAEGRPAAAGAATVATATEVATPITASEVVDGEVARRDFANSFDALQKIRAARGSAMDRVKAAQSLKRQIEIARCNIDVILAATILHAADHYFAAQTFPLFGHGYCDAIFCDVSGLIQHLVMPINYRLWSRLMYSPQVYLWSDPLSQAIYKGCKEIEPAFADTVLMIGCAV